MRFRPCIDIHNGKVKQIVGGSLADAGDQAQENFTSEKDAAYYAGLYRKDGLEGGHIILLNPASSEYYQATKSQALSALMAYPGGMQVGGGITAENAEEYINAGASHVIVTSYVFRDGKIHWGHLNALTEAVGKDRVVLDLSCRKRSDGRYYIVTNRWQTFTDIEVTVEVMEMLGDHCGEFLVHGVDAEGKCSGAEDGLVRILAEYHGKPVTYAGGIESLEELERFRELSGGRVDFTIGSALDLFGGKLSYEKIKEIF